MLLLLVTLLLLLLLPLLLLLLLLLLLFFRIRPKTPTMRCGRADAAQGKCTVYEHVTVSLFV